MAAPVYYSDFPWYPFDAQAYCLRLQDMVRSGSLDFYTATNMWRNYVDSISKQWPRAPKPKECCVACAAGADKDPGNPDAGSGDTGYQGVRGFADQPKAWDPTQPIDPRDLIDPRRAVDQGFTFDGPPLWDPPVGAGHDAGYFGQSDQFTPGEPPGQEWRPPMPPDPDPARPDATSLPPMPGFVLRPPLRPLVPMLTFAGPGPVLVHSPYPDLWIADQPPPQAAEPWSPYAEVPVAASFPIKGG